MQQKCAKAQLNESILHDSAASANQAQFTMILVIVLCGLGPLHSAVVVKPRFGYHLCWQAPEA
eukprot:367869-Amphidinium_carterae.1